MTSHPSYRCGLGFLKSLVQIPFLGLVRKKREGGEAGANPATEVGYVEGHQEVPPLADR